PPGRRAVPVVRHPVDYVRRRRADSAGLFRVCRDPGAPRRQESGLARRKARAGDRRRETHRPLRTAALSKRHSAVAAACTARESCTARRRSATDGGTPSPRVGRICSSYWYWVGPPRRTPSAPANAASTTPALGLGCRAASRRQARTAPHGGPPK